MSTFLTRPIYTLIKRINKISKENDLSHDPEIEKRGDEIGHIGRAVNEMSGNISRFLVKMEEQYRQQKDAEIALLQTQINPHFIYNTLDSIQWMAKIQNNTAIADIIRSLTNLLRNIAAMATTRTGSGKTNAKTTLSEELQILNDYVEIMSVRFMGNFEVIYDIPESFLDCHIPQFTLQPLVENAIIHGIEPSGRFGIINIGASRNDNYLDITVADNGMGMSPTQLKTLTTHKWTNNGSTPSLNRIGIANVDERLKLLYGKSCGLFFESREGEYTKATIRIVKEQL